MKEMFNNELVGIGECIGNLYDDYIVDERFCYYLIFNYMFGFINGFGIVGLIKEEIFFLELRFVLELFFLYNWEFLIFLRELLDEDKLVCKVNLLMRFFDVDELSNLLE